MENEKIENEKKKIENEKKKFEIDFVLQKTNEIPKCSPKRPNDVIIKNEKEKKRKIETKPIKQHMSIMKNVFQPKIENKTTFSFVNHENFQNINLIDNIESEIEEIKDVKVLKAKKIEQKIKIESKSTENKKSNINEKPKKTKKNNFFKTKIGLKFEDNESNKKLESIKFLLDDDELLSTLPKKSKAIIISAVGILQEVIQNAIFEIKGGKFQYENEIQSETKIENNPDLNQIKYLNDNFGISWRFFKNLKSIHPLLYLMKYLTITKNNFEELNILNIKPVYKKFISTYFLTSQIINVNNNKIDCNNTKKIMTTNLKLINHLSGEGLKILNKIGLIFNTKDSICTKNMIDNYNLELLHSNKDYFLKNLFLTNTDNLYYFKTTPKIIEPDNKTDVENNEVENNEVENDVENNVETKNKNAGNQTDKYSYSTKSTTIILRFPGKKFFSTMAPINLKNS
jgi:hypothetical protein